MKYARYEAHGEIAYGVVEGDAVLQIEGSLFGDHEVTDHAHGLAEVKLLAPTTPSIVYFMGGQLLRPSWR
jgi:hypothetical protein